ncbi:MAG TPA: DNA (cytosine-5-)-methyltransferase [Alcanivorax sp.]|nr:DNA (cytosine-5-)-methyltransferase [Alcanivorax sp.]
MKSVELFAGAGGLALGSSLAGFEPLAVVEWDRWACDTIRENQKRGYPVVKEWPVWQGDVRAFDWSSIPEDIDLLAGGPPCQPFSMGGKHKAFGDKRDMFPATAEAVRRLKPKAFIVENVRGLLRPAFSNYFEYIKLQLEFPEACRKSGEDWIAHFKRLQREKTSGALHRTGLTYNIVTNLVNAADYGIPQKRERVFIVGFRSDLDIRWNIPDLTHSHDALLHSQWVTGEYWDRHGISARKRPRVPANLENRVKRLSSSLPLASLKPWRTVRDALQGIPDPRKRKPHDFFNHRHQPGAKVYPGHTGSPLDLPAKTLKAGDHGVPGGENMMILDNGEPRYFSVRESARIQTFPDGFVFHGSWTETMRQLGNAVPVALARTIAASVGEQLMERRIQLEARARQQGVA